LIRSIALFQYVLSLRDFLSSKADKHDDEQRNEIVGVDAFKKLQEVNPMMRSKNYEHRKTQKVIF
jgi:hypothetical protein